MKCFIIPLVFLAAIFTFPAMAGNAGLEKLKPISVTVAHSEAGDPTNYMHGAALAFKDYVEHRSGGKITVQIAAGGALGDADACMMQVMSGTLEIAGSISDGAFSAVYPNYLVYSIPYLFHNQAHALQVYHGKFGREMWDDFAKQTGAIVLASGSGGFRSITNNKRPIKTPDDIKGLKIRTMNMPAHMEIMKALGASVTPISWSELYSALQTGVIDGQENGLASLYMGNLYEVQKYLTLNQHVWTTDAFVINKSWFEGLPDQYQRIIEVGGMVMQETMQRLADVQGNIAAEVLPKTMKVYQPTQEELAKFRDASQQVVLEFIRKNVKDPAMVDKVLAAADKALVELGYKK